MTARRIVMTQGLCWLASLLLPGLVSRKTLAAQHEQNRTLSDPSEMPPGGKEMPMPGGHTIDHGSQFPREIKSKTIRRFSWQDAIAEFGITRKETHAECATRFRSDIMDTTTTNQFQIPLSSLDELQAIIDKHHLVQRNGFSDHVGGLPSGYGGSLSVKYASGETLWTASNHVIPIDSTAVDSFYAYFENLSASAGLRLLDAKLPKGELMYLSIERTASGTREFYQYDSIPDHKSGRTAILSVRRQTGDGASAGASSDHEVSLKPKDMDQLNALIDKLDLAQALAIALTRARRDDVMKQTAQDGFAYRIHGQWADGTALHADTIVKGSEAVRDFLAQKFRERLAKKPAGK